MSQACLGKSTSFTLDIHNMANWQLSKQDSHWPVPHDWPYSGLMCQLIEVTWFIWKLSADQLIVLLDRDQWSISYFLASLGSEHRKTDTHIGHQCCDQLTCQKKVSADQYHLSESGAQVSTHRDQVFFWSYPLTRYWFSNDRRVKFISFWLLSATLFK